MKKTFGDLEEEKNRPEHDVQVSNSSPGASFAIPDPQSTTVIADTHAAGVDFTSFVSAPDGAGACCKSTASLSGTGDSPLSTQVGAIDSGETGEQLQVSPSEEFANKVGSRDPQRQIPGNAERRTQRSPTAKFIRNAIAVLALLPAILSLMALPPLIVHDRDALPLLKVLGLRMVGGSAGDVCTKCRSDLAALLLSSDSAISMLACDQYRQCNRIDEAESLLQNAIKAGTTSGSTNYAYACCRSYNGNYDASTIKALEKAIEFSKTGSVVADGAAYQLLLLGSRADSRLASHLSPYMRAATLAVTAERDGKLKEAQVYLNQAVAGARSGDTGCLDRRALFYLGTNQLDEAKRDIDAAENIDSTDESARLDMGWYYLSEKKLGLALAESDMVLNLQKYSVSIWGIGHEHRGAACHKLRADIFAELAKAAPSGQERQRLEGQSAAELAQFGKSTASGELFMPLNTRAKQHNQTKSAGN